MEKKAIILFIVLFLVINFSVLGQNIGIGTSTPDESAVLEINSNDKGLLIPRMDSVARKAILSPATGLLVFDIDNNSFWYKTSSVWVELKPAVFENNSGTVRNAGQSTDDFVFGRDQLPQNNINISDRLFFFDESKGAFRAGGLVLSNKWSTDSLGLESAAFGKNTVASGNNSFSTGFNSNARGNNCVAMGNATIASGDHSLSIGSNTKAYGTYSVALGYGAKATGPTGIAIGNYTNANGYYSTALGFFTTAGGKASIAMGDSTNALGNNSASMGEHTKALAISSLAIGRYNEALGSSFDWVSTDPIFEIGIGSDNANRKNALTILKNGKSGLGTSTPDKELSVIGIIRSANEESETNYVELGHGGSNGYINTYGSGYLAFRHDGITKMVVTDQKKVGIGTTGPSDNLHIVASSGEDPFRVQINSNTKFRIFNNGSVSIGVNNTNISDNDVYIENQLGLGVSSPTYRLHLPNNGSNSLGKAKATAWDTYSDSRVKKEVENINYGLDEVLQMNPVKYHHHSSNFVNGNLLLLGSYSDDIGFLAQELHSIIPEVVNKPKNDSKELWSMNYEKLTPVLVKAIQQQQNIINSQNQKIRKLEDSLKKQRIFSSQLDKRLSTIENSYRKEYLSVNKN